MAPISENIAESVSLLMYAQHRTNKDLAKALGVAESRVSMLVNGKADFTVEQLFKAADWLGVTPSQLRDGFELTPVARAA